MSKHTTRAKRAFHSQTDENSEINSSNPDHPTSGHVPASRTQNRGHIRPVVRPNPTFKPANQSSPRPRTGRHPELAARTTTSHTHMKRRRRFSGTTSQRARRPRLVPTRDLWSVQPSPAWGYRINCSSRFCISAARTYVTLRVQRRLARAAGCIRGQQAGTQ